MRFRTLTGAQRHRVTNMLFFAGVVSAIGTVTGTSILGCPAVNREGRLDDEGQGTGAKPGDAALAVPPKQGLKEKQYVGGQLQNVVVPSKTSTDDSIDKT
ncbi:hypothetical protein LPJ53_003267 [Coemansia erecta]|uniref:Uncharacterized protein n=1 Tax=Coemansia erecta TaxID=147472 RepID=A0A9W7Y0H9_9FUNG|nr:hypothetical protein LPJ53_003267 [Coemansia erecta]